MIVKLFVQVGKNCRLSNSCHLSILEIWRISRAEMRLDFVWSLDRTETAKPVHNRINFFT